MGSFLWVLLKTLIGSDGEAEGTLRCHKTFVPYPDLQLAGCGIFRDPGTDRITTQEIDRVIWIDDTLRDAPGSFQVDLGVHESEIPLEELKDIYAKEWTWE